MLRICFHSLLSVLELFRLRKAGEDEGLPGASALEEVNDLLRWFRKFSSEDDAELVGSRLISISFRSLGQR